MATYTVEYATTAGTEATTRVEAASPEQAADIAHDQTRDCWTVVAVWDARGTTPLLRDWSDR